MVSYTITTGRYDYAMTSHKFKNKNAAERFLDGLSWRQIENIIDILRHAKNGDRPAWEDFF